MATAAATMADAQTDATELYRSAIELAEDERYEEALALLAEARRSAPEHLGLYLTAAQILAEDLEEHGAAAALVEEAERLRPGAPAVAVARADLLFYRGEFSAAESLLRQLVERPALAESARSSLARALLARGRQLVERGGYDHAVPLLRESASLHDSGAVHLNLGICFHALRDAEQAYQEYAAAVDLDPHSPLGYYQMGLLMADCSEMDRATAAFAQTLSVDADHSGARHRLAGLQAMAGNLPAAANILREGVRRDPDCFECRNSLALALQSQGEPDAALPELEAAARLKPDDFMVRYTLGGLYVAVGQPAAALPHLERARDIDPELFAEGFGGDEQFAAVRERPEFALLVRKI